MTFNAGLIWRPSSKFNLGFVIRDGARFKVQARTFLGGPQDDPGQGADPANPDNNALIRGTGYFHVPTVVGAGLSFSPFTNFKIAVDADWIQYSSTAEGYFQLFDENTRNYKASNGYEYRAGAELAITQTKVPILLRVGGWKDPEHRVRFNDPNDEQSLLFRRGHSQTHISGGIGLPFSQRLELNAAYDHSDLNSTASISLVTRFQ